MSALMSALMSASAIGKIPTETESMAAQRVIGETAFEKMFRMIISLYM
jgi:hypothetical protein